MLAILLSSINSFFYSFKTNKNIILNLSYNKIIQNNYLVSLNMTGIDKIFSNNKQLLWQKLRRLNFKKTLQFPNNFK